MELWFDEGTVGTPNPQTSRAIAGILATGPVALQSSHTTAHCRRSI